MFIRKRRRKGKYIRIMSLSEAVSVTLFKLIMDY